jgi:WD40 repeat protein
VRPEQGPAQVHFGPRGRLVTSASLGETIEWDARTGRVVRRHPIGGNSALAPDGRTVAIVDERPPGSRVALLDLRTGHRSGLRQDLPDEQLLQIAYTADGAQIVGATSDRLHIWDRASGRITESFGGGTGMAIPGFVLDGRGSVIASAGTGAIGAWDLDGTRRLGRRFRWGPPENACIVNPCTVPIPRSDLMATTQFDGTAALLDVSSGRQVHTLPARDGSPLTALAVTADGRRLATGGPAGTVTFWDVATRRPVRRMRFAAPVFAAAFSADGRLLAVTHQVQGATDAKVEVRDLASGRTLFTRRVRGGAGGLQFTRDARALVASGCCRGGSTVASWDARTGAVRFDRTTEDHAITFALTRDSRTVLVGDEDGAVRWFDARSGRELGAPTSVADEGVTQVAVSPDGRRFAVADFGGGAALWDIGTRKRVGDTFPVGPGVYPSVAFDSRGRLLITESGSASAWPTDRPALQQFACRVAGRDLTRDEWQELLPGRPYRHVCPGHG